MMTGPWPPSAPRFGRCRNRFKIPLLHRPLFALPPILLVIMMELRQIIMGYVGPSADRCFVRMGRLQDVNSGKEVTPAHELNPCSTEARAHAAIATANPSCTPLLPDPYSVYFTALCMRACTNSLGGEPGQRA